MAEARDTPPDAEAGLEHESWRPAVAPARAGIRARPLLGTLALGAALLLAAGTLDAEPLYVPGAALVLVAALAVLWVLAGGAGIRVERTIATRRVEEDDPVHVTLRVTSPRPLPTGSVLDELLPEPVALPAGHRSTELRIRARFSRRGRKVLAPARVAVRDPIGLLTRVVAGGTTEELLVLPRIEPVGAPEDGGTGTGGAVRRGRPAVAAEVELDGLRQHREGTSASRIFWPSLARGGDLLERRLRAESDTRPLVVLDPRGATAPEDLDAAVRAAASLAVDLAQRGGCAHLFPGDRRPGALDVTLAGWPHLHARLALVDGTVSPPLTSLSSRRGPILYVTARRGARPPRALAEAPGAGGRIMVVPGALPGRRASFVVAGCHGYTLGGVRDRAREAVA